MAKLHFYYSTMNAGKSTLLLQANHNYRSSGHETLLFIPEETKKISNQKIVSRIGLSYDALVADKSFNFLDFYKKNKTKNLSCILVDEAQFLKKNQVRQLSQIADIHNCPVMCYGIRTDFKGELFEGSKELLAISDNLIELKTICTKCTRKATMVIRIDKNGDPITEGEKIKVGGDDSYQSVCRKHFRELTKLI